MHKCIDDDADEYDLDNDPQEDDAGILRIGNLILCSMEEWLRRQRYRTNAPARPGLAARNPPEAS